jgi:hypothetical protein
MKSLLAPLLLIATLLTLPAMSKAQLPSDKYEQPRHTVVEKFESIEVRDYAPMLIAEVELEGDREAAIGQGFRILAGYIFGGNVKQEKIAMTSPVTQQTSEKIAMTAPVTQAPSERAGRWKVAFILPKQFTLETIPKPNDSRIQFRIVESERRVAIRFSGLSTNANLSQHKAELEAFVTERKFKALGQPQLALYDDPFTLPWNRRNEWWIVVGQ